MFGIVLSFLASIFSEVGTSIGKHEVQTQKESIHSLEFFSLLWGTIFFFGYAFATSSSFVLDPASFPTLSIRIVFEIILAYFSVRAVVGADRSTYGFLRILTLPFLLVVDFVLGYAMTVSQEIGISIIVLGFIILFVDHGIRTRSAGYVLGSALLSVVTISLYKYDITNFNSVPAEQGVVFLVLMIFYFLMARLVAKENPFQLLRNPTILMQSFASGIAEVFFSFTYLFATASVMTTAKRAFGLMMSVLAGNLYFKEKHLAVKMFAFAFMVVGIVFLAF